MFIRLNIPVYQTHLFQLNQKVVTKCGRLPKIPPIATILRRKLEVDSLQDSITVSKIMKWAPHHHIYPEI